MSERHQFTDPQPHASLHLILNLCQVKVKLIYKTTTKSIVLHTEKLRTLKLVTECLDALIDPDRHRRLKLNHKTFATYCPMLECNVAESGND